MNNVVLMLGGNEGDTRDFLRKAIDLSEKTIGQTHNVSAVYSSGAWGFENQPDFLNQAICVKTNMKPEDVLKSTKSIEKLLGKNTQFTNGPRNIDIDIMFYNDLILNNSNLIIPHPRLHLRRFNLAPLAEIIPEFLHPVFKVKIASLLMNCEDPLFVKKLDEV